MYYECVERIREWTVVIFDDQLVFVYFLCGIRQMVSVYDVSEKQEFYLIPYLD